MRGRTKKQLEARYFKAFREKVAGFPDGQVVHSDAPDFLVTRTDSTVGIEVTQIFRKPEPGKCPDEQFETEEQIILDRAQSLATVRGLPPTLLHAYFSRHTRPTKQSRDSISERLVRAIADNLPADDCFALRLNSLHGLPCEIDVVSVRRYPSTTASLWQHGGAGAVMEDCIGDFQAKIDVKEGKLAHYRNRCHSCWLLIVADCFQATSAFYEPNATTAAHEFTSAFDCVYFLEVFSGRVLHLRLAPPTIA